MEREAAGVCLVVDDSEFDRRWIARVLRGSGLAFRIHMVPTLALARRAVSHPSVAAIVLDNALPDGKGVDFAIELAGNPRYRRLSKVLVTEMPSPFMWEKARAAGITEVVLKGDFDADCARRTLWRARAA